MKKILVNKRQGGSKILFGLYINLWKNMKMNKLLNSPVLFSLIMAITSVFLLFNQFVLLSFNLLPGLFNGITGVLLGLTFGNFLLTYFFIELRKQLGLFPEFIFCVFLGACVSIDPIIFKPPILTFFALSAFCIPNKFKVLVLTYLASTTIFTFFKFQESTFYEVLFYEVLSLIPLAIVFVISNEILNKNENYTARKEDQHSNPSTELELKENLKRSVEVQSLYRVLIDMMDNLVGKTDVQEVSIRLLRTGAHSLSAKDCFLFISYKDFIKSELAIRGFQHFGSEGKASEMFFENSAEIKNLINSTVVRRTIDNPVESNLPDIFHNYAVVHFEPLHSADKELTGFYSFGWEKHKKLTNEERQMSAHLAVLTGTALESTILRNQLSVEAQTDTLTGLFNRRAFFKLGERDLKLAQRNNSKVSLIALDIDFFKKVNDTHGHAVGDIVLTRTAQIITNTVRGTDIVSRMGGEEFVALLPNALIEAAEKTAERIRLTIEEEVFQNETGEPFQVTSSFGVTQIQPEETLQTALSRADKALYMAKENGRNQTITLIEESQPLPC